MKTDQKLNLIGLVPAAGQATRISPSPCSKEIFPVGLRTDPKSGLSRPKVVSHYLLEKMRLAGVTRAYFILRPGKWDIPAYFGDGSMLDMNLGYLIMGQPYGPPYTLDQAFPFVQDALVAFGFPDILFGPEDAFVHLIERQEASQADVVLGLWPAHQPEKMDMIEIDDTGRIRALLFKPHQTQLIYTWLVAVWTPAFTSFLHSHLQNPGHPVSQAADMPRTELTVGNVIQAAIQKGLRVMGVPFPKDAYVDIGTPEDLGKILGLAGGICRSDDAVQPFADRNT